MTRGAAPEALLRDRIREALRARDQELFERVAVFAGITGSTEPFERIAREELADLPHDLRTWWETPCNCTGQLN